MTETPVPGPAAAAAPKALPARFIGVLTAPRATYAAVAAAPHWLGIMAIVVVIVGAATAAFMSTDVGQKALLEQQVRFMQSFGITVTDAVYQRLQAGAQRAAYTTPIGQVISLPLTAAIIAGIALGVFNAIMGGDAKFKQVYAVVAHSGVIIAIQTLFTMPLNYARGTLSSATNLAVFVPMLDENSFIVRVLGSIDLFLVWWTISLAIGLGVLYKRRTQPIAITLLVIYIGIGVVVAAIKSAVGS